MDLSKDLSKGFLVVCSNCGCVNVWGKKVKNGNCKDCGSKKTVNLIKNR